MIKKDDDNGDIFLKCLNIFGIVFSILGINYDINYLKYIGFSSFIGEFACLLGYYIWIRKNREKYNKIKGVDPL